MSRRRASRPAERSHLVFSARTLLGAVRPKGAGYLALDRSGKRLGLFLSLAKACYAVRRAPRLAGVGQ